MKIDHAAIERAAEAAALRVLAQTTAMLTFRDAGFTGEAVRALGQSMAAEVMSLTVADVDEAYAQAVREANKTAVVKLFNAVADAVTAGEEGATETQSQ